MAKEQYSMPGKKCIDHALNRRLIFDKTRYTKRSLAMTSCDLKSCYDRIVHVAVILSLIRAGIPLNPAISMFQTLQDCQHSIRTAFGDSEETYAGKDIPFINSPQGIGQVRVLQAPACFKRYMIKSWQPT